MDIKQNKDIKDVMTKAESIARNYFRQGLNCSECLSLIRYFQKIYSQF